MKKTVAFCLSLVLLLSLAGCGGSATAKNVPVKEIVSDIVKNAEFEDQLMEMDASVVGNFYKLDESKISEYQIYTSATMSTPEEIAVFKVSDSKYLSELKKEAENRIATKSEEYEDYRPEQMPKLKNASVTTVGDYLLLAISVDSSKPVEIFNKHLK